VLALFRARLSGVAARPREVRGLAGAGQHPDAMPSLRAWLQIMPEARYTGSTDVKRDFASVSFLGDRRTVFNIAGNKYRLIVDMRYRVGRVYVRHITTHAAYDRLTKARAL
jgi:mRNA interferase HigB